MHASLIVDKRPLNSSRIFLMLGDDDLSRKAVWLFKEDKC
jgi:hypothetical protein